MNKNLIKLNKNKEKSKKVNNKKIISLLLAGASFSSNLQQGTYAMKSSIATLKSNQNEIIKDQENQTASQNQNNQATTQDQEYETMNQDQGEQIGEELPQGEASVIEELSISKDKVQEGSIEIPEDVKKLTIEEGAFEDSPIKVFKIPEGVEEVNIGEYAFS